MHLTRRSEDRWFTYGTTACLQGYSESGETENFIYFIFLNQFAEPIVRLCVNAYVLNTCFAAHGEQNLSQQSGIHEKTRVKKQMFIKDSNVSFKLPKAIYYH